jgi:hypothetical protein
MWSWAQVGARARKKMCTLPKGLTVLNHSACKRTSHPNDAPAADVSPGIAERVRNLQLNGARQVKIIQQKQ